jgi:Gpi18-like mannosyltransferase
MTLSKDTKIKAVIILLVFISIVLRIFSIPKSNYDMSFHNVPWYMTLYNNGIANALGTKFADYTPPYTYFIALATFTHDFIPPLTAIKLIPICFDILGAFLIYKIVKLKFEEGYQPALAAAIYFTAPSIILNSAYWGQADSLYTLFLLICLYFLMTERPFISILALGLAFSIKFQGAFLGPFLLVMAIRKKIPWWYFGMVPLIYLIAVSPVVLLGRSLVEVLLIYKTQSTTYPVLAMHAATIYSLFPREWYSYVLPVGVIVAITAVLSWVYTTSQNKMKFDHKHIILIAFLSVALVPFVLPKMHDRYFYPADVLSIVLAFYWPALWFVPLLYQLVSTCAISVFLFGADSAFIVYGFLFNAIAFATVLRTQWLAEKRGAMNQKVSSVLSWLITILTPVILFGIGLNFLLTPAFIRTEYAMPYVSGTASGFNKSERFQRASQTMDYLTNDNKIKTMENLKFNDNTPVFKSHETAMLENAKKVIQKILTVWNLSLALCYILSLFAWAGDWLPNLRHGMYRGGWLSIGLAVILGIASLISRVNPVNYFQSGDTFPLLFPASFWLNSLLFILLALAGSGFLLTRIATKQQV